MPVLIEVISHPARGASQRASVPVNSRPISLSSSSIPPHSPVVSAEVSSRVVSNSPQSSDSFSQSSQPGSSLSDESSESCPCPQMVSVMAAVDLHVPGVPS